MTNSDMINKNKKIIQIGKYMLFFISFYVLSLASVNAIIYPFAFGLLFALVWCNQKPIILAPLYIIATFLASFNLYALLSSVYTTVILLLAYFIHYRLKKPLNFWFLGLYAVLSQALEMYFGIVSSVFVLFPIINLMVGVLFMYATASIFQAILLRGFAYKLTLGEMICAGTFLLVIFDGLSTLNVFEFSLSNMFASFLILIVSYSFSVSTALIIAPIMGLGCMLGGGNPITLAIYVMWAVLSIVFKTQKRYICALALIALQLAVIYYFKLYADTSYINLLPVAVSSLIFTLIPKRILDELNGFFSTNADRLAMRNIVNRNRDAMSRRLGELSDVFCEMNKVFRAMIKGGLSEPEAKKFLATEIREKCCKGCTEYNRCHRINSDDTNAMLENLVGSAFTRDKVALFDIPASITSKCPRINTIITETNDLSMQYKKYAGYMTSIDASKVLIAEQLGGVSVVMKNLSKEINNNISFDAGKETKIIDEMTYNNIICTDAVIYEQDAKTFSATVIIRDDCLNLDKIEKIVSGVVNAKMIISGEEQSPRSGWSVLTLKNAPKYDLIFGSASQTKTGSIKNGDSYSLTRIENDKFMLALCDGMGSGEKAEKASNLAIGLVENFYKAGFDNELILSSVNKLLALGSDEVFSALDLCVIDLNAGAGDMIKLGAPNGFVKRRYSTDVIDAGSLPLGILGNVEPVMKKVVFKDEDIVLLCTDGVVDSFYSVDDLKKFVSDSVITNPQLLADSILKKALENCKNVAIDDMTVVCARIFKRA